MSPSNQRTPVRWRTMNLINGRNQCAGCAKYFESGADFDAHRTHGVTHNGRFCLTHDQLIAKGMTKNADGFWVSVPMQDGCYFVEMGDRARKALGESGA